MAAQIVDWGTKELRLTDSVSILQGANLGSYPSGNSVLIRGSSEAILIDPSVTVVAEGGAPVHVDAVVNSHGHEDHLPGNGLFTDARVHIHEEDLPAAQSLDGLLDIFGFRGEVRAQQAVSFVEEMHYAARPDAEGFRDGHTFDLGEMSVTAMHLPGHTRGHSGFHIDGGVFFLSDIDLTGFGPYYGDVWSDLDQFEESLRVVRDVEARHYVTFHQKGVIEGQETFVDMLDKFHSVIGRRHGEMLEYLVEPHSLEEMATRRFVYRPHVDVPFVETVEYRTAELHVARMVQRGEAVEIEPGRFQRV
ncbi:MAG: glyoxylase-like metal-dependent hydrolase (beta-lactamase superfamily II) [Verrucomicrobiales bacterium]|jgi:glyoxylase-like metal-dependent hydrolase (beta-lactamase superfamily II)